VKLSEIGNNLQGNSYVHTWQKFYVVNNYIISIFKFLSASRKNVVIDLSIVIYFAKSYVFTNVKMLNVCKTENKM
jgi:hypothetical protein